jgi:hypothetical protein
MFMNFSAPRSDPKPACDERVRPVGDVGERATVNERGRTLDGLDHVGLERLLQEERRRPRRVDVLDGHRVAVPVVGDDDAGHPLAEVGDAVGETQDGHHLRGRGQEEAVLAGDTPRLPAEADDRLAERPVVHVDRALPAHLVDVDPQLVPLVDVVVQHRRDEVVRRGQRVDVAREVEVDVLHREHLGVAAAGGPALDPEHRPERRLADGDQRVLAVLVERLAEPDRGDRLSLAHRRRRHPGHEDQFVVGLALGDPVDGVEFDLRLVLAEQLEVGLLEPERLDDVTDVVFLYGLCDLVVGGYRLLGGHPYADLSTAGYQC